MYKISGIIILITIIIIGLYCASGKNYDKCPEWNISDMAVGSDGKTIYIIAGKCSNSAAVYKSIDCGITFSEFAMPSDFNGPPRAIAIAPDNPQKLAVVDSTPAKAGVSEGGIVWRTTFNDQNWQELPPVPNKSAVASTEVADIAVGPARIGMIFGRNYLICSRDNVKGVTGRVHTIGTGDQWEDLALVFKIYPMDFTSCRFSPGYIRDRCIVTIGSTASETYQDIMNMDSLVPVSHVLLETGGLDSPGDVQIVTSDIALPSDFNPSAAASRVSFVAWDADPFTNDDVYIVSGSVVSKLNIPNPASGIKSIAYAGTIASGQLFAGMQANTNMYYASNPNSTAVKWKIASVLPAGKNGVVLGISPDYTTTHKCYAGTSGIKSSFFISTDNGDTFR